MVTQVLSEYIAKTQYKDLPGEVIDKCRLHIIDTFAAIISGTTLPAGQSSTNWIKTLKNDDETIVIGTQLHASSLNASLVNGMLAHADETDDSHAPSLTHPGCAIIPAAYSLGDSRGLSGQELIKAVTVGYDIGPRISKALGGERFFDQHHSSHSVGGLFGALAASASLLGFNALKSSFMLGYGVQMASGNACWRRDPDHVEKAFDFGGMPAHNAVLAASMVSSGFTSSRESLEGVPGLFAAYPLSSRIELATEELGSRHEIMYTAIKKWCVGSPIQSALDSVSNLMAEQDLNIHLIDQIVVDLPAQSAPVVDKRDMPAVNLQFQLSLLLIDGKITFHSGHDYERMNDPVVVELMRKISIKPRHEQAFIDNSRQAIVTVMMKDQKKFSSHTLHVRGTPKNPMTKIEIHEKAFGLIAPVLGDIKSQHLIDQIDHLENIENIQALRSLLTPH